MGMGLPALECPTSRCPPATCAADREPASNTTAFTFFGSARARAGVRDPRDNPGACSFLGTAPRRYRDIHDRNMKRVADADRIGERNRGRILLQPITHVGPALDGGGGGYQKDL